MRRFPRLTRLAAHGVLAMECAFPLAFAAKGRPRPSCSAPPARSTWSTRG